MILEIIHATTGFQRDQIAALACFQERTVNICAVSDAVRLAESFQKCIAKRNICNQLTGKRVAHFLGRRPMRIGQHRVLESHFFQYAKNIGTELDARSDLAEFRCLLEHPDRKTLVGESIGSNESADASAGDKKRGGVAIRTSHEGTLVSRKTRMRRP